MQTLLAVAAGGAIGAAGRYLVSTQVARWAGTAFPWGTLTVNVLGAAVMGLLVGLFARVWAVGDPWRAFLTTGILGGFTTFSAFSLEATMLWGRAPALSIAYVAASVLLGAACCLAGFWLFRR